MMMGKISNLLTVAVVGVVGYLAYKFITDPLGLGGIGKGISDFFGNLFPGGILAGGLFPGGILKPVDEAVARGYTPEMETADIEQQARITAAAETSGAYTPAAEHLLRYGGLSYSPAYWAEQEALEKGTTTLPISEPTPISYPTVFKIEAGVPVPVAITSYVEARDYFTSIYSR